MSQQPKRGQLTTLTGGRFSAGGESVIFLKTPAPLPSLVSSNDLSEITCWIACDLFQEGRRIPVRTKARGGHFYLITHTCNNCSAWVSGMPENTKESMREKKGKEKEEKEEPFSLRYLRQSSRVSWEMSSSVSSWRGLSSIERRVVTPGFMAAESGPMLAGKQAGDMWGEKRERESEREGGWGERNYFNSWGEWGSSIKLRVWSRRLLFVWDLRAAEQPWAATYSIVRILFHSLSHFVLLPSPLFSSSFHPPSHLFSSLFPIKFENLSSTPKIVCQTMVNWSSSPSLFTLKIFLNDT